MPTLLDCAIWLQDILGEMLQDDVSAISFVEGNLLPLPDNSAQRWQLAVDVIYRCVTTGLIRIFLTCDTPRDSVLPLLQKISPFQSESAHVWDGTYFRCTDRLNDLFDGFPEADTRNGPANVDFVGALDSVFTKHGVAWSEAPLLPIHTTIE